MRETGALQVPDVMADDVAQLQYFLRAHRRLFVLTGAGISTHSGIPDYRDRSGAWKGAQPIQHQDFVTQSAKRRRYWARSMVGWPAVARARPGKAHYALARLGAMSHHPPILVTQNVDGLHQTAGNRATIDLHGRLGRVICLSCNMRLTRQRVQDMLMRANHRRLHEDGRPGGPGRWISAAETSGILRPDGDIDLDDVDHEAFRVPGCPVCGGILKPDVVFFGGAVPKARVQRAWAGLDTADAVLVVGSSLMVWSGFRFVCAAIANGLPVWVVNQGKTRADDLPIHKLVGDCDALLDAAIAW